MAISLKHAFASAKSDGADATLVQPSNWNAEHNITMATGRLLGRTTASAGAVEEISAGTALSLSGLTLAVSTVPVGNGGTNLTSYTTGDILYASNASTLAALADVATGNALISGGIATAPSWGKIGLTTHVSGTLAVGNGGTGVTTSTGSGNVVLSASPDLTGTPTAPSAAAYTNSTQIATTAEVYGTVTTVPENAQTNTSYTLALSDSGKVVTLNNASAITLTIPTNNVIAFATNTRIDLIQLGAGQVTVGGASVTIRSSASKLKLNGQYSGATLWKKGTDEWVLIGDIVA